MYNILICDDEKDIRSALKIYLSNENYNILEAENGVEALEIAEKGQLHLALMDIMMPEMDGITAMEKLREKHNFPIIMISAKSEDNDKVMGLNLGADDYITKPFNPLELVARVKAQLRRYQRYNDVTLKSEDIYDYGGLFINKDTHECMLYGKEIALTPIEFNILWLLCENNGKVVSSEEIFEKVWGEKYLDSNNTVMVHIRRIREKLGEPPRNPKFIKTVWGVGYKVEKQ